MRSRHSLLDRMYSQLRFREHLHGFRLLHSGVLVGHSGGTIVGGLVVGGGSVGGDVGGTLVVLFLQGFTIL